MKLLGTPRCTPAPGLLAAVAMTMGEYRLVHTTALAIVPPEPSWPPIQSARERLRDGGLFRWPPHINVFYPLVEPVYFERLAGQLAPALAQCAPFRVRLDTFRVFGTARRGVVWLEPSVVGADPTEQPFARLYERLVEAAPEVRQPRPAFVPHLTVTHTDSAESAQAIAEQMQAEWAEERRSVEFEVAELAILCRSSATQPFRLAWRLPLGSAAAPPYAESRAFDGIPLPGSLGSGWQPLERQALHARMRAAHERRLDAARAKGR